MGKTYIDTSKIQVEFAHEQGSDKISRPWSKYSHGSSAHRKLYPEQYKDEKTQKKKEKKKPRNKLEEIEEKIKSDAQLREFLDLHENKTTWKNDLAAPLQDITEEQQKMDLSDAAWLASKKKENDEDEF